MNDFLKFVMITALIAGVLCLLIAAAVFAVRWARKGSTAASFIGWSLLLLGVGMNPQPPPQEQVEEANKQRKIKKTSETGDPESW